MNSFRKKNEAGQVGDCQRIQKFPKADLGMLVTRIPYENVTLVMYGKADKPDRQRYTAAIISWKQAAL